jgi:hypothetical protein
MEGELEDRIAVNESVFREINEGIERGQWPGEEGLQVGFRCECARLGCNQVIELTVGEYERVRAHPRRFMVAVGHEMPEAEAVIETKTDYVVVEKLGQAGRLAESTDPRA